MGTLKIRNLSKQTQDAILLSRLSIDIEQGSSVGIRCIGAEAAVLFDLLEQRIKPSSGEIQNGVGQAVSMRFYDGLYENLTVREYLTVFAGLGAASVKNNPDTAHFSLDDCWRAKIEKLTNAQKRRLELLRMYLSGAPLLLFESPLDNIDLDSRPSLLECFSFLKDKSRTLLFTSDNLEHLFMLADSVYLKQNDALVELRRDMQTGIGNDRRPFRISCRVDDRLIFLSPDEIDYAESINGVCHVSVDNETFPTTLTMNELEQRLTGLGFFRCHRSCLVNLQRVRELISYSRNSYTIVLSDKAKKNLPLSRDKVAAFKSIMDI